MAICEMIDEFDKEIDSLLRKTARGGNAFSNNAVADAAHIDADEISLFAENALPQKMRAGVTRHLADCERCRKILSNLVALDSEIESENVHAAEGSRVVVAPAGEAALPWYKKLLAFPQMAYVMGALALVFSAFIAVMILQNARQSQNSSVAQLDEASEKYPAGGGKGMSSDGDETASSAPYPTPNAAIDPDLSSETANTLTPSNTTTSSTVSKTSPLSAATNSNASASSSEGEKQSAPEESAAAPPPSSAQPMLAAPKDKPATAAAAADRKEDFVADGPASTVKRENESRETDDAERARMSKQQADISQQEYAVTARNQTQATPDTRNVQNLPMTNRAETKKSARRVVTAEDAPAGASASAAESKNKSAAPARTRTINGKTFTYSDGVWYDSTYNRSGTTNVRRGTEEYKKLDENVRSIAQKIGGTIVIVWKGTAYRIN